MLVKHVHIDRNAALSLTVATLYMEQFPLRLTAVLSDQRQASFHKYAPYIVHHDLTTSVHTLCMTL